MVNVRRNEAIVAINNSSYTVILQYLYSIMSFSSLYVFFYFLYLIYCCNYILVHIVSLPSPS